MLYITVQSDIKKNIIVSCRILHGFFIHFYQISPNTVLYVHNSNTKKDGSKTI